MEEDSPTKLQLPTRQYNQAVKFHPRAHKQCVSNFFGIDLKGKNSHIYQYSFDCQPSIPQDSKDFLKEVIFSIKKQVKDKIDITTFSGNMIWGLKELAIPLNVKSQFLFDSTPYKFDVIIKLTKTLSIDDCSATENGRKMINQILNNKIKQVLRKKNMDELTRGKYFDAKEIRVNTIGLSVIRGFKFTLCHLKSGLHLQIDTCSRVFRSDNLLEEINRSKSKDFLETLIGATVITTYGKRRTYKINRVCKDMTPYSKFYSDTEAGQIAFSDYYNKRYGLKVNNAKQPLIEVTIRVEKRLNKEGQMVENEIKGFLIPEFVSLTGMSDEQRADYSTMRDLAPYTKLEPSARMQQAEKIKNVINDSKQCNIDAARKVDAFQLVQPNVRVDSKAKVTNHQDGAMNIRDRLKKCVDFKDWVIVYSLGKNPKYDDNDADSLVSIIKKASQAFGVRFDDPGFITCNSNSNQWKEEIKADIDKNGKPQIVVLFFNPNEERFYGEMKRFITCDIKIPCQAIRKKTILKGKNPLSAASKIVMQMNQKVGGTAWEIIPENTYTGKMKTMYGSFAISKGKKGFTLAFTGTIDQNFTKIFNSCKTGYKNKENIPQVDFETMMVNWAKNYVSINKAGPQLIIIYREGLSVQQIQRQVKGEIEALRNVIKKIGTKTGNANYNPEIIYSVVNTKINTRIFDSSDGNSQSRNSGKFQPRVSNPQSGTCVLDQFSVDQMYDFHLAAQKVTQGTCTPTHYIVAHNSSKMSQEDLAQFTYQQCFNYYNWTGAVKVPATLQCSNKLAKLVGESIQADVTSGEVQTSFYFL